MNLSAKKIIHLTILIYLHVTLVFMVHTTVSSNAFDELFDDAVVAYDNKNWSECYDKLNLALGDFKFYRQAIIDCRLHCNSPPNSYKDGNDLTDQFINFSLRKSVCLRRCRNDKLGNKHYPSEAAQIYKDFRNLKPYDYLQICAFENGKLAMAAGAAYTYHIHHRDHAAVANNVKFLQSQPNIMEKDFVNLEETLHQSLSARAVKSYQSADYLTAADQMERAVGEYFRQTERCEAECEGPFDLRGTRPDFYEAFADQSAELLKCRAACPGDVISPLLNVSQPEHYISEMYNYLQFSYYKLNLLAKGTENVESFLLLRPDHDVMQSNKKFYLTLPDVHVQLFKPRQEVVDWLRRRGELLELLEFVETSYVLTYEDLQTKKRPGDRGAADGGPEVPARGASDFEDPVKLKALLASLTSWKTAPLDESYLQTMQSYRTRGVQTAEPDVLGGRNRVLADGLLDSGQCRRLVELAKVAGRVGDGYESIKLDAQRRSPYTKYEDFRAVQVSSAAEMAVDGIVSKDDVALYVNASNDAMLYLEKAINLDTPLYFHFTHLVCRTASSDQSKRSDISHPIHSDNCIIQSDNSCLRKPPAFVARDFSSLLYLNDDFEGGDFFFAHRENRTVDKVVKPTCGRLVGFEADDYHGVQAVSKGTRCAIALWFTVTKSHREAAHIEAEKLLASIEGKKNVMQRKRLQKSIRELNVDISKLEQELGGNERFLIDGLATKQQCAALVTLNNAHSRPLTLDEQRKMWPVLPFYDELNTTKGLPLQRVHELTMSAQALPAGLQALLRLSEAARQLVESYFQLASALHFDFTHLVCRTSLPGVAAEDRELSHPVHADNCVLQPDGSCLRQKPAYVQRDYSAVIYLNENFEGGNFFFSDRNLTRKSFVKPACGRMVAFNAAQLHGVEPVLSGQRCAIAIWFTLDESRRELAHEHAQAVLDNLNGKSGEL